MSELTSATRAVVVARAGDRCEYCGLAQVGQEAVFHIDHVIPRAAGGGTVESNLALACVGCSLHKAAKRSGRDRQTDEDAPLFNPRLDRWMDHFRWQGVRVVGITATGRATVQALRMNRELILGIRAEEAERGRHPHM